MNVNFNSAYSNVVTSGAGSKLYVPVSSSVVLYSHFDHVSGFVANKGQNGVSITKIQILNTLIDHLSSIKSGKIPAAAEHTSPEQIDSLIENYQSQIRQAAESTAAPYILSGTRPEAGALFSLSA